MLDLLDEASHVGGNGDEDRAYCQELIVWAGKIALGKLDPVMDTGLPGELYARHAEGGGTSYWLEI